MGDAIQAAKEEMASVLNSSAFSTDSIEGWILIILILCLIYGIWKRAVKAINWSICVILFCQIMYGLSLTGINNLVPLNRIFKFDVVTAIAQCFAGTKLCDILLYFNSSLLVICQRLWDTVGGFLTNIRDWLVNYFKNNQVLPQ